MLAAPKNCSFEEQLTAWRAFSLLLCFVGSCEATFHAPKTFSLFNISQIVSKQCVLHIFIHYDLLIYCGRVCMEIFIIQSLLKPHTWLVCLFGKLAVVTGCPMPPKPLCHSFPQLDRAGRKYHERFICSGTGRDPSPVTVMRKTDFFFFLITAWLDPPINPFGRHHDEFSILCGICLKKQ